MINTVKETKDYISKELSAKYESEEISSIANIILRKILKTDTIHLVARYNQVISPNNLIEINKIVKRVKEKEPIQHILGETEFLEIPLKVSKDTFIPRQETEYLVKLVIKENLNKNISVLDIGTGSGCIAIVIKKHLTSAKIMAIDCCKNALEVAKENTNKHHLDIKFKQVDILAENQWRKLPSFSCIVSNPPYVMQSEEIDQSIAKYEPNKAIFVEDKKPLVFYNYITDFSMQKLHPRGKLYFEINEKKANETYQMAKKKGFKAIKIYKDFHNKDRILCCEKS